MVDDQGKASNQEQAIHPSSDFSKMSRFYTLISRCDQEDTSNFVTSMLQVFFINVYALLDSSATFYFVTPLVEMKFYVSPDVLIEPFLVTSHVGDSVLIK